MKFSCFVQRYNSSFKMLFRIEVLISYLLYTFFKVISIVPPNGALIKRLLTSFEIILYTSGIFTVSGFNSAFSVIISIKHSDIWQFHTLLSLFWIWKILLSTPLVFPLVFNLYALAVPENNPGGGPIGYSFLHSFPSSWHLTFLRVPWIFLSRF